MQDEPVSHLDGQRFTIEEYKNALAEPIDYPDPNDHEDPRYYKKYAHTLAPPEAYFILIPGWNKVNTEKDNNARTIYGWNNITEFEKEQIEKLKE